MNIDHFEILSNGYKNHKFKKKKKKLAEALHIKHERPTLNVQSCSADEVQRRSWIRQTFEMEFFVKSVNCFGRELFSQKVPSLMFAAL